jgi:hypothetical protein
LILAGYNTPGTEPLAIAAIAQSSPHFVFLLLNNVYSPVSTFTAATVALRLKPSLNTGMLSVAFNCSLPGVPSRIPGSVKNALVVPSGQIAKVYAFDVVLNDSDKNSLISFSYPGAKPAIVDVLIAPAEIPVT